MPVLTPKYEVPWHHPQLQEITLLRLRDLGHSWSVLDCRGNMRNGDPVIVALPFDIVPKGRSESAVPALLTLARRDKVYLQGLGLWEEGVLKYER